MIPESTKTKSSKSSASKCMHFGKDHEIAFRGRVGRGGGRGNMSEEGDIEEESMEIFQREGREVRRLVNFVRSRGWNRGGEKSYRFGK